MRKFISAIVLKDGDVVCAPELTDCYDDLIEHAEVEGMECTRVQFTPPDAEGFVDPDRYELLVVQPTIPGWFDSQMQARTAHTLRDRVRAMIITDTRTAIMSGCWIVARYGQVNNVVAGRILHVAPGGVVQNVLGGAVIDDVYGTVNDVRAGGVVRSVRSRGTVVNVWGKIGNVWGVIGNVWNGGTVNSVRDGGVISNVWNGSTVDSVRDGGVIGNVWTGGTVGNVSDGGQVGGVWPGGTVGRVQTDGIVRRVPKGTCITIHS